MDTLYFAFRMRQKTDGTTDYSLSSGQDKNSAESLCCERISADMNSSDILSATNIVINSEGNITLKKYFTHDATAEIIKYYQMTITQYTEESQKPVYKAIYEFDNEYNAESSFWQKKGQGMKDTTVAGMMNIVLNSHGGSEIVDFWNQYPDIPEEEE